MTGKKKITPPASAVTWCLIVIMMVGSFTEGGVSLAQEKVVMSGPELEACSVALARFKQEQPRAEISNYHISVKEHLNEFEIAFVPNQPSAAGLGPRQITLGGSTLHGPVVYYFISKDKYEILRRSFAR